jgi:hypothetical protein
MYFELRGTLLKVFLSPDREYPEFSCSMLKAKCGVAADCYRFKHVIRLRLGSREQYLLRPVDGGLPDVISWLEHFQSAANISPDIDKRRMLHVYTLARDTHSSNETRRTMTLIIGQTQAIVPVLKP